MAIGLALDSGVNSFARGLALGDQIVGQKQQREAAQEDRAFTQEARGRQRQEWQNADQDRQRAEQLRQLQSAAMLVHSGAYDLQSPKGKQTLGYVQNMRNAIGAMGRGELDDQTMSSALESFNQRHYDDINKGTGTVIDADVDVGGRVVPKGSKIERKEVTRVFPQAGGNLLLGVKTTATTPDGQTVEWENFVTQNRSMAEDDPAKPISVSDLMRSVSSDMSLLDMVNQNGVDKTLAWINSQIIELGGQPLSSKQEEFKREEGDKTVTYQRDAYGNVKKVAEAPRWQPEKGTDDQREYQLAKREGFKGSFLDFKQAQKGQGLSVTLPDGTVVQQGGSPMKLSEQQSKDLVYWTRGESALKTLDPIADELAVPTQAAGGAVPVVGNAMVSPKYQQANQAGREFLAAILRKDTGAAITDKEMKLYGETYLPQPFDSPVVLEQKKQARAVALDAIRRGLGTAQILAQTKNQSTGGKPAEEGGKGGPTIEDLLKKYGQ